MFVTGELPQFHQSNVHITSQSYPQNQAQKLAKQLAEPAWLSISQDGFQALQGLL